MEHRRVILQLPLELYFVEPCIVKGAEACCQAPECSDKPEPQIEQLDEETELRLLRKAQAILGFPLDLNERISRLDREGDQAEPAVHCICKVTDSVCNPERLTIHITAIREPFHP